MLTDRSVGRSHKPSTLRPAASPFSDSESSSSNNSSNSEWGAPNADSTWRGSGSSVSRPMSDAALCARSTIRMHSSDRRAGSLPWSTSGSRNLSSSIHGYRSFFSIVPTGMCGIVDDRMLAIGSSTRFAARRVIRSTDSIGASSTAASTRGSGSVGSNRSRAVAPLGRAAAQPTRHEPGPPLRGLRAVCRSRGTNTASGTGSGTGAAENSLRFAQSRGEPLEARVRGDSVDCEDGAPRPRDRPLVRRDAQPHRVGEVLHAGRAVEGVHPGRQVRGVAA
eukprot:Selendium_serpulae@DN6364_c5_g1_i8.p1